MKRFVRVVMKNIAIYWLVAATFLFAQDTPTATFRLQIRMKESPATTRNCVLTLQNKTRGSINASRRIPYYTNSKELHMLALGTIIECAAEDKDGGLRLDCHFESSHVAPDQPASAVPFGFPPVVRSRQVKATVLAPIGREVSIARLDDPASGNTLEIFILAERFAGSLVAGNK